VRNLKDLVLIATIPNLANMDKVERVFSCNQVAELRFNTGVQSPFSPEETLGRLFKLSVKYNKTVWIDIKGRQLRVAKWADPLYSCIELNHTVQLEYPAKIIFRGGDVSNITHVKDGNKIFVDPLPRQALGAGQSVNIKAKSLNIQGYLTEQDKRYLMACNKLGIKTIMASFVEDFDDLMDVYSYVENANMVLKIESLKGIDFIRMYNPFNREALKESRQPYLMAARDDLFLETGQSYKTIRYLEEIYSTDNNAICASRIFSSLEKREKPDLSDFSDLELMYNIGYRKFMLSDNICNYSIDNAIKAWEEFTNG